MKTKLMREQIGRRHRNPLTPIHAGVIRSAICFLAGLTLLLFGSLAVASGETYTPGERIEKDFGSFAKSFISNRIPCTYSCDPPLRATINPFSRAQQHLSVCASHRSTQRRQQQQGPWTPRQKGEPEFITVSLALSLASSAVRSFFAVFTFCCCMPLPKSPPGARREQRVTGKNGERFVKGIQKKKSQWF